MEAVPAPSATISTTLSFNAPAVTAGCWGRIGVAVFRPLKNLIFSSFQFPTAWLLKAGSLLPCALLPFSHTCLRAATAGWNSCSLWATGLLLLLLLSTADLCASYLLSPSYLYLPLPPSLSQGSPITPSSLWLCLPQYLSILQFARVCVWFCVCVFR